MWILTDLTENQLLVKTKSWESLYHAPVLIACGRSGIKTQVFSFLGILILN
jgi:hypothetical protein